jgi:PAS domain S-box-containing protein
MGWAAAAWAAYEQIIGGKIVSTESSHLVGDIEVQADTDHQGQSPWRRWAPLFTIGITGLLLSVSGWLLVSRWEADNLRVDFERRTGNFMAFLQTDIVQEYTSQNQKTLVALRDAITEDGLHDDSIQTFRSNAMTSDWINSTIVLIPRVPKADIARFTAEMERSLGEPFEFHGGSVNSGNALATESLPVHYPIIEAASQRDDQSLIGLDVAMSRSATTALEAALSRRYPVSFGLADDNGVLNFFHLLPLPSEIPHPTNPGETFEGFVGVVTEAALGDLSEYFPLVMGGVDTYLISTQTNSFQEDAQTPGDSSPSTIIRSDVLATHGMAGGADIDMGGLHWNVVSAPREQLYALHNANRATYIAMLILALTALIAVGTVGAQTRAHRIDQLIRLRTRELSTANEELGREICERKKTESALLQSQEMYELLSKNVSDVIWTTDLSMALNYISPSVKHLRGFTEDEARQQDLEQILTPESFTSILPFIAEAIERVERGEVDPPPSYTLELDMFHRDGSIVRTETTASVLLNTGLEMVGFLGVTRDIEARKQAEQETSTLETQLRQSQKMEAIGTLAGGIAHDFNNLLTGILGYANLLKLQTNEETSTYEAADVIEKAAQRASELTKQLLGFARQGKLQNSAVDLHALITESVELLRRTIDKSVSINLRMDADTSEVMGDPSQLQLVMLNLAVNARDAMPDGGDLTVETTCIDVNQRIHADLEPGSYLRLRVSDSGAGIPADIRERIFEPFFTTKAQGQGTGMGLATVYGIVKNHDGNVTVESAPGNGTTFEVLLPLAGETADCENVEQIVSPVHGRGKILVVEDEEVVRKLATEILGWLGYETVTVCDGVEAVEYYDGHNDDIDLALIDLNMPRMGGRECYQEMKKINPGLRAVLSTGYSRDGAAQEILDDGVQGFVQKPFQASQLSEAIALAMK